MTDTLEKTVLILSGGMDSATLLYKLLHDNIRPICVSFNYGQRHKKELICASELAKLNGLEWELINLEGLGPILKGSSQTDLSVPVPTGRYDAENMKLTVVPNRNMIMLSVAMGLAIANGIETVHYGAHAGDHTIYPDCRPKFVEALNKAAALCDWKKVQVIAPYLGRSKSDICKDGVALGVPYDLTWTCYAGTEKPCGKCGSCSERLEAFALADAKDPLVYEDSVAHG